MDDSLFYIFSAFMIIIGILNVIATYIVLNTYFEVKERRLYQIAFIWFVPFIGSILAIFINREEHFERKQERKIGNNTALDDLSTLGGSHYDGD